MSPPLYAMVGGSAPTVSTNRRVDSGRRPVARQTRTPRACAAVIARTTPGGTTLSPATSVPSMSSTRSRYGGGSGKGQRHLGPAAGAPVARFHELGRPQAVLGRHGRRRSAENGVEELAILQPVPPLLLHGELEEVPGRDLAPDPGAHAHPFHPLRHDGLVGAEELDPLEREDPGRVRARVKGHERAGGAPEDGRKPVRLLIGGGPGAAEDRGDLPQEEPAHIEEVNRGLVQEPSGQRGGAHPRGRLQLPPVHLHVRHRRPELLRRDQRAHERVRGRPPAVEPQLVEARAPRCGRGDLPRAFERGRHRLLAEDVDARAEGGDHRVHVVRVRRGHVDGLRPLVRQRARVGKRGGAHLAGEALRRLRADVRDADQGRALVAAEVARVDPADVSGAEDADLDRHRVYAFSRTAPNVSAEMTYRRAASSRTTGTSAEITPTAAIWFQMISNSVTKLQTAIENVCERGVAVRISAYRNSLQLSAKVITAAASRPGDSIGRRIWKNARHRPAPSTSAASSTSCGTSAR